MKNKVLLHELILMGVIILLTGWRVMFRSASFDLSLLWWILGVIIGFLFVFSDRLIYSLFVHTDESLSVKIRGLLKEKRIAEALTTLINERAEQRELVMRSVLFVAVWLIMALFTLTSSLNFFGRGFVLGIGTHLVFDFLSDFMLDKNRFDLWFWQIKRQVGADEKKWFLGFSTFFYILLASGL